MAKEFAKNFYKSARWARARNTYIRMRIAIDGGMCERCHARPGYIVHHKTYITPSNITNPDVTLSTENLEYLCHECHDREHDVFEKKQNYYFRDDGEIIFKK